MVVKPFAKLTPDGNRLIQTGLKVRGREYLRMIYGPDYTEPDQLVRLWEQNVAHKRSMALREYAPGSSRWNSSWPADRSGGSTRPCLPFWPWSRSRWILRL